ncbi:MAG: tRNA (adenosine(37)-N6)-threonylcarbamoyltransferase complex transferase subunit TsaD [Elusimicrobia bacterium CG1_02_63_36]|nr:MAG: tRNA (adenosine(37)-N6)-threonylcarbamoyltransferase complex transferase subunit TsaD [Elusimicrobia bacterium CG1_02_63_36]PIP83799.1 MAG: tRNA (adenosine(37)-N6)-threonylcarbamoyltransferase complex transferase subunit TsaD [Elusimicrobia bacterium CG22_combo_CG10-13_8_21_14_all_63_91]PJA16856.1 MAG: tRNA (adenosine(37)-N6)-threonylcarbamoyltransferase complex transferase subunit TsaD [Elusimicrobia bacterium CG_4_10_14_0_2_um_filter_63_34]PJB24952.1 MAG: tRNA (adenosine(37)-N6)-threon
MPSVLGIETSCDETSAAVVNGRRVLSNVISSQIDLHRAYSGVVPEIASRAHCERIGGVVRAALKDAFGERAESLPLRRLVTAVAYTRGPGLAGALLVGKTAAEALARASGLPLIGVNHLEAHALAMDLREKVAPPFLSLVVSGGHTELISVRGPGRYRVLGRTRDDAAGEVFDKVAKLLRLGYPGGPVVDRLAREGYAAAIAFPRASVPGFDFSFSGLKTAVLYHVRDAGFLGEGRVRPGDPVVRKPPKRFIADVCASFQEAVVDSLSDRALAAAKSLAVRRIVVGGGVAANSRLRDQLAVRAREAGMRAYFPPLSLCTDNAAMIAYAGGLRLAAGRKAGTLAVDPALIVRGWAP